MHMSKPVHALRWIIYMAVIALVLLVMMPIFAVGWVCLCIKFIMRPTLKLVKITDWIDASTGPIDRVLRWIVGLPVVLIGLIFAVIGWALEDLIDGIRWLSEASITIIHGMEH
jgi:hypothetical protein